MESDCRTKQMNFTPIAKDLKFFRWTSILFRWAFDFNFVPVDQIGIPMDFVLSPVDFELVPVGFYTQGPSCLFEQTLYSIRLSSPY